MNDNAWALHGGVAVLRIGAFSGRVDVLHPELGLQDVHWSGSKLAGRLICVRRQAPDGAAEPAWPLPLADAYVRGGDLVTSYQPTSDWPYAPQIYWRTNSLEPIDGLIGSLSLLVSVQTHLLDTWPRISVGSQLACDEALYVTAVAGGNIHAESLSRDRTISPSTGVCCIVRRLRDVPVSYAEIMPASDFREVTILHGDQGDLHVQWELFADFLEKGVIRRARLQSAFLRRENDVELAAACCDAMEQRPLPLTT